MSVDTYAVCPCGSGKKIKFCKCKDSVGELDRVLKMVEGGQVVPALDRLATILQEHPDAAWALAIRGRLLLDLREYDSLAENAERFTRLQPSNPLALTQRAAANIFKGDIDTATSTMLEALTESGRDVDAFVLDVGSVLAYTLAQSGRFLTARVYATLAMMASGYEGGQTSVTVLRQLNSAPTINQLMKAIPPVIERPSDAEWAERYDEANALLRSNKVAQAETKLESLQRSAPGQPAILSGLLTCAIWRGDIEAQGDLLKKLSACETLEFEQRVRFRAMAALVDPETPELSVGVLKLSAEIESAEQVEMAMMADSRFVALPADMLGQMRVNEDDVPPRAGFQILDRDKPESLETLPEVDDVPEAKAIAFVYGKQTDRSARVEVLDVRTQDVDNVRELLANSTDKVEFTQEPGDPLPLLVAAQPPVAMIRYQAKPAEAEELQQELTARRMPKSIASAELPLLGGKSLIDTAADDSLLLERTAVVRVVEQYDAIASKSETVISEVYDLAKIEKPGSIQPSDDEIESLANEDLNRVDPANLSVESKIYLLQRSQQVSATPAIRVMAKTLINAELTEEQKPAKMVAYMTLINASEGSKAALATLEEAKAFAESNELSTANLLLSEVSLRLQSGDGEGFQAALQTLSTRHGNEPEIMAQLQQMLMAYGLIRPDGSPRQAPAQQAAGAPAIAGAPASGGSELWTPDSGSPSAPAKPAGEGGGKLWVPGMD
ncbi:MAG: protein-disulfide isomerase [Pirellulaceae bacterium]|nr:protein-disulfide isomerase [Pirellulaceae bacterium]